MLASQSNTTYAVEPFLLVQIAYNTAYMGVVGFPAPLELLIWEQRYKQRLISAGVVLGLHGFDTWFWWHGLWTLKPTNGPEGNPIYFPYLGRVDLGQSWVKWLGRGWTACGISLILLDVVLFVSYCVQQGKLDRATTPETITNGAAKWLEAAQIEDLICHTEQPLKPGAAWSITNGGKNMEACKRQGLLRDHDSDKSTRVGSKSSTDCGSLDRSAYLAQRSTSNGLTIEANDKVGATVDVIGLAEEPKQLERSYRHHTLPFINDQQSDIASRSDSGPMGRLSFWPLMNFFLAKRRKRKQNYRGHLDGSNRSRYEPTFYEVSTADAFLTDISPTVVTPHKIWSAARDLLLLPVMLPLLLCTNKIRPGVLLAAFSYRNHKRFTSDQISTLKALQRTLHHPLYPKIRALDIVLIARIRLTLSPPPAKPRRTTIFQSVAMFGACAVLIISTELTIQWNYITGIQSIDNVGQCIPFAVGVGGLLKVVYAAIFERGTQETVCYGRCAAEERQKEWKEAAGAYQRAKDCMQKRKERMPLEDVAREMDENIRKYEFEPWASSNIS